jgi:hypothetical protein
VVLTRLILLVLARDAPAELPHAHAKASGEFWDALGTEEQQNYDQDEQ